MNIDGHPDTFTPKAASSVSMATQHPMSRDLFVAGASENRNNAKRDNSN